MPPVFFWLYVFFPMDEETATEGQARLFETDVNIATKPLVSVTMLNKALWRQMLNWAIEASFILITLTNLSLWEC